MSLNIKSEDFSVQFENGYSKDSKKYWFRMYYKIGENFIDQRIFYMDEITFLDYASSINQLVKKVHEEIRNE